MKKRAKLFLCLNLSLLLFCGCGKGNESSNLVVSDEAEIIEDTENAITLVFGQITEINGEQYTISLAEQPQFKDTMPQGGEGEIPSEMPQGEEGEMPSGIPQGGEGEMPPGIPQGGEGEMPPGIPQGGEGEMPPEMPQEGEGEMPPEMHQGVPMQLTFTGETKVIHVDSSTLITINGEHVTKDKLNLDDIVTIEMSGEEVISISVGYENGMKTNAM